MKGREEKRILWERGLYKGKGREDQLVGKERRERREEGKTEREKERRMKKKE